MERIFFLESNVLENTVKKKYMYLNFPANNYWECIDENRGGPSAEPKPNILNIFSHFCVMLRKYKILI